MAASPKYKVFNPDGEYIGCCKYAEDAAALASIQGADATVRLGHAKSGILLTVEEGGIDSYDDAAESIHKAETEVHRKAYEKA